MSHFHISNETLLKLILQFLLENGLYNAYFSLSEESGVYLDWVENIDKIKTMTIKGLWSELITILNYIKIPLKLQIIVFEHIILELLESKEPFVAQLLIENVSQLFSDTNANIKYNILLEAINKSKTIISNSENNADADYSPIYEFVKSNFIEKGGKEESRIRLSNLISKCFLETEKSKLIKLIGNSFIKLNNFDLNDSFINRDTDLRFECSLFHGSLENSFNDCHEKSLVENRTEHIDIEKYGHINYVTFPPFKGLVIGTSKGYIIIINNESQEGLDSNSKFIYSHCEKEVEILCLSIFEMKNTTNNIKGLVINRELSVNFLIASTSNATDIKVWDYSKSTFIASISNAHEKHIMDFTFNRDGTCILSGSYDGVVKIHGLKSMKVIKYFSSNGEFTIRKVSYNSVETLTIAASNDGNIIIWDIKSSNCIAVYNICSSNILELKIVYNPRVIFTAFSNEKSKDKIKSFDFFLVGSKKGIYIVNISNGEKNQLRLNEYEQILSNSYNSNTDTVNCLSKNSEIIIFDIVNRVTNSKKINDDLGEYEKIKTNEFTESVVIHGKKSIKIFYN
ncbi:WD40 repeat-containing protein SMU1 [Cryptosporidium felis]|nr:WD40 repeat-containing protein SMU1 [Cryptosporidium felis]